MRDYSSCMPFIYLQRSRMIFSSNFELDILEFIEILHLFKGGVFILSVLSAAEFNQRNMVDVFVIVDKELFVSDMPRLV